LTQHRPEGEERPPLPLVPTRELIVFPKMIAPLFVGREKSVRALERAHAEKTGLILCSQREPLLEDPGADDILPVGTLAAVLQLFKLPDGSIKALVEGRGRVRVEAFAQTSPEFVVAYTPLESPDRDARRSRTLARRVISEFLAYVQLSPQMPDEAMQVVEQAENAGEVADIVAAHLLISNEQKQRLLETASAEDRLTELLEILAEENAVLAIEQEIAHKVQRRIEDGQRQIVLHEKLRAIREEIESEDGDDDEVGRYVALARDRDLSAAAAELVDKEIRKLRRTPAMSAEVTVIRGLLDTLFDLPWGRRAASELDLRAVARHLDKTHYGLQDVKDRILEYLAVCSLLGSDQPGTILCLAGPPGTGKSSIARAIAGAMHRPFVRISLGGVRDEAEIRGHRRTYVGAMPGRIIEGLVKAGVDNPVVLLDEIDKLEYDFHGNPAAALMEVLDPVQNRSFRDNYLETDYDLSHVFFVATANDEDEIHATLYDRLEVIHLTGYTTAEKLRIAGSYLVPRIAADTGLRRGQVRLATATLRAIIRGYTREAGVRALERCLRRIYRKVARRYLEGTLQLPVTVTTADLHDYLGEAHWLESTLPSRPARGQSLGLAYTSDGGEVLTIEASISKGRGELLLTGQLGEVMQESASAAWGYVLGNVERDPRLRPICRASQYCSAEGLNLANYDVRVHVPEGAVPKDGPSAGLALAAALLSALTGARLKPRVAMTGEITLSGRVLKVGGLKEKCLAAVRAGVTTVVLPEANRASLRELPQELTGKLRFVHVESFTDALDHILA
jgi:ATP-dependent Lon protease